MCWMERPHTGERVALDPGSRLLVSEDVSLKAVDVTHSRDGNDLVHC
jgi:hypothetical protein